MDGKTPGEEVYRACAEASWALPGVRWLWSDKQQDVYVEMMLARPDWRAQTDVAYQAGREDAAREIEQPGSILCDCSDADSGPANPTTLVPMDHHCDCAAVQAAATMLGALSKTNHGRQCIHGTEMDEFYEVNQQPRTPIRDVGDNTEEQQREGPGES